MQNIQEQWREMNRVDGDLRVSPNDMWEAIIVIKEAHSIRRAATRNQTRRLPNDRQANKPRA